MPKKGSKPQKQAANETATQSTQSVLDHFAIGNVLQTKAQIKRKGKRKETTYKIHEDWFYSLPHTKFIQLTKDWNAVNLEIKLKNQKNYDAWLNYFKTMSPNQIRMLAETGLDILPTEGYAALSRWHDIISNPGRIDKIHKAGLTGNGDDAKTITALAAANDRYGVLKAIRDQLAARLQNNPGNRDTADLSKQLTEIMTQIADYERRLAPDKKTVLGDLLSEMPPGSDIKSKRPAKNGGGHRQGSFSSRVTIKDIENN